MKLSLFSRYVSNSRDKLAEDRTLFLKMILFRLQQNNLNFLNSKHAIFLLTLFLLIFPKGGIKVSGVPITWGYLLLGLFSLLSLIKGPIFVSRDRLNAFMYNLPFLLVSLLIMAINGTSSIGTTISFWTSFLFLPFTFLILFSKEIDTFNSGFFFKIFKNGIFLVALYGIILFAIKQISGKFLEIPLLTVNLGDLGELESKHINRGGLFKLISTYNNGNIFGVCMLMLLPLYCFLENRCSRRVLIKLALFLTFSRTVWIGLFFHELGYSWLMSQNKKKWLLTSAISLGVFAICLTLLLNLFGFSPSFLFAANLGGRRESLEMLKFIGFFSNTPFSHISEIVYAGIVLSFGWAALPLFLFGMCAPLLYRTLSSRLSPIHKTIAMGLGNYLLVSGADGAILFLPTMAFYWFLLSFLYRKEIKEQDAD